MGSWDKTFVEALESCSMGNTYVWDYKTGLCPQKTIYQVVQSIIWGTYGSLCQIHNFICW